MPYRPTPIDYSNRETFTDERLLNDHKLLKGEITHEVEDFLANLLDDYDNLRKMEDELVRRGLIAEVSPLPFFAVMDAE